MMNKRIAIIAFFSLALGLTFLSVKMLTYIPTEKPVQASAPTQLPIAPPATSDRLEGTTAPRDLQKDNETRPKAERVAPEIESSEEDLEELASINATTIVGTEWGDDKFKLEFGPRGKLIIGGNVRANWRIEGDRIKLYSNDGREVHWLEIDGNRLTWNGKPVGRFK